MKTTQTPIANYLKYKQFLASVTFQVTPKGEYAFVLGEKMNIDTFRKAYPEPYLFAGEGVKINPEKSKMFLANVKSYR
jgi:hypothetical protein